MSNHYHAVVWIDHHEARVLAFNAQNTDKQVIHAHEPHVHLHHKANSIGDGRAASDPAYFDQVAAAVAKAGMILITGPSNAKLELKQHISRYKPVLAKNIVGVETVDHPTDGELTDYARRYFTAADRLRPLLPE